MPAPHARTADLTLRAIGIALIAVGWAAFEALAVRHRHAPAGAAAYALAATLFVSTGVGAVLVVLGDHVFDEIAVSARWAQHGVER